MMSSCLGRSEGAVVVAGALEAIRVSERVAESRPLSEDPCAASSTRSNAADADRLRVTCEYGRLRLLRDTVYAVQRGSGAAIASYWMDV